MVSMYHTLAMQPRAHACKRYLMDREMENLAYHLARVSASQMGSGDIMAGNVYRYPGRYEADDSESCRPYP